MKISFLLFILFFSSAFSQTKSTKEGDKLFQEYLFNCSVKKNGEACFTIGNFYYVNKTVTKAQQKNGIMYLDLGCKFNNKDACRAAGMSTYFGEFQQDKNESKGLIYLSKGCELNDSASCYYFGLGSFINKSIDKVTFKNYIEKSCKLGDKLACGDLKKIKD